MKESRKNLLLDPELENMLFNFANLPYWILLGAGILMFLFVISTGLGEENIDIDSDNGVESLETLGWLGIGQVPLILLLATDLSFWGLIGWTLNILFGIPNGFFGVTVFIASMILSLILGSFIARPIGKIFFQSFGEDVSSDRLLGCIGTVTSTLVPKENQGKIAQVDVIDTAKNLVTINANLPSWATKIPHRGEKIIVIDRQTKSYLVIAKDSVDRDRWLSNSSKSKD